MPSRDRRELDRDQTSVVEGLRAAQKDSGLTQTDFARALGTSGSRMSTYLAGSTSPSAAFFVRAARLGRGLRTAAELHRMTPAQTAAEVRTALGEGDEVWALKMMLQGRDDLRAMLGEGSAGVDAWECDPGLLGSPPWDALFSALVAHEFEAVGREQPRWTRPSDDPGTWVFTNPYYEPDAVLRKTPDWLAARGVYLVDRDLVTA